MSEQALESRPSGASAEAISYHYDVGTEFYRLWLDRNLTYSEYSLHTLRHAAASVFIEQGFTPKRVQTIMGHSSIQVTFDIYGHLFRSPEGDQAAMEQLQARLGGEAAIVQR